MKLRFSALASVIVLVIFGFAAGCGKPNDSKITSDVQQRINADSGLRDKQISVTTASGVVTLAGNVDNVSQQGAAGSYATSVKGVKQVVNNLQIAGLPGAAQASAPGQTSQPGAQKNAIPPGTPTPDVINKKLSVFVYAANKQPPDQQQYDEMDCYNWASSQTSIDPFGPPTPVQQVEKGENQAKGARVKGATRGAVGGAVIGSISGNAGRGSAIGATAGTLRGGQKVRQGKAQAEQDYQDAQAQAQQQAAATDKQKIVTFKKAFSACVQGRGYTVQ